MRWPTFLDHFASRQGATVEDAGADSVGAEIGALFDEELLARLRRLVLLSHNTVSQGITGEHRSRRKGASPEFADFRNYAQGDDFRRIDWNIYGRLDALFIRLSEITTEFTVHILVDASKSMEWRGPQSQYSKFSYARRLAGSLAYVSLWHFDRVVITPFSDGLGKQFGPVQGRSQIQAALRFLTGVESDGTTNILNVVQRYTSARQHASMLILISDLLSDEPESLQQAIRHARHRGWRVSILHIIDPAELTPEAILAADGGSSVTLELIDLEAGDHLRLSASDALISRYCEAVERWKSAVERICIDEQADYVMLQTDWSFEHMVLRRLYEAGLVA